MNLHNMISEIIEFDSLEKYYKFWDEIHKITIDMSKHLYGEEKSKVQYTNKDKNLCIFFKSFDVFMRKNIPWEEWSDIAEEGLVLLKKFNKSGSTDCKGLPIYEQFMIKITNRINDLINSGKYDHEFQEWGKDN